MRSSKNENCELVAEQLHHDVQVQSAHVLPEEPVRAAAAPRQRLLHRAAHPPGATSASRLPSGTLPSDWFTMAQWNLFVEKCWRCRPGVTSKVYSGASCRNVVFGNAAVVVGERKKSQQQSFELGR